MYHPRTGKPYHCFDCSVKCADGGEGISTGGNGTDDGGGGDRDTRFCENDLMAVTMWMSGEG